VLVLGSVSGLAPARGANDPDDTKVVARVGDRVLTVGAVERRLKMLTSAGLEALGGAPSEAPERLVEQVLSGELSAELAARARGLERTPEVQARTREILRQALDRALRVETLQTRPVTDAEIAEYYQVNRTRFEQPPRIRVWRILVDDAALAERVLADAKKTGEPIKWSELTRQHSVDKATNMRQGDLGFVRPDGSTDVPRVQVDPALFKAVETVKDGEFVPRVVPEAGKFAVVWRRGSVPAKSRSLADESGSIRQLLERRRVRVDDARKALVVKLRTERVKDEKPELLELVPADLVVDERPARTRPVPRARKPELSDPPEPGERGLR
jgi:peptidyl-prolyl cis-trans isomerase C